MTSLFEQNDYEHQAGAKPVMSDHPITQAREVRNLAKQLAMYVTEPLAKRQASDIAKRAETLLRSLSAVMEPPRERIPSNKSEWD
jgi:hypothetical protein